MLVEALQIPLDAQKSLIPKMYDLIDNFSWHIPNVIVECAPNLVDSIYAVIILILP